MNTTTVLTCPVKFAIKVCGEPADVHVIEWPEGPEVVVRCPQCFAAWAADADAAWDDPDLDPQADALEVE